MKNILLFAVLVLISIAAQAEYPVPSDYMITKWDTDAATSIVLPATGNFIVMWEKDGDPNINGSDTLSASVLTRATLTFSTPGVYIVKIIATSSENAISFSCHSNGVTPLPDASKLVELMQWGTNKWTTAANMFIGCTNMDITASDTPDFSQASLFTYMFKDCESLKGENHDFNAWNLSPTDIQYMFANAKLFNRPIQNWDLSACTNFARVFFGAESFNQPLNDWVVSNATRFDFMFYNAKLFNRCLSSWNTKKVTNMRQMFNLALSFNQSLSNFSLKSVPANSATNLYNMLSGSGMNSSYYSANLIAWANDSDTPNGVIFGANDVMYTYPAADARNALTTNKGWVITDAGIDPTSAVLPSLPVIPNNINSITSFGAIPNDGIDDTQAIQNAINTVSAIGGGRIVFPNGVYDISIQGEATLSLANQALILRSKISLEAENSREAILRLGDNQPNYANIFLWDQIGNADDVRIKGLVIDANSKNNEPDTYDDFKQIVDGNLIRWLPRVVLASRNGKRAEIDDVHFTNLININTINLGVSPGSSGEELEKVSDVTISNCLFDSVGWQEFDFDHSTIYTQANGFLIKNNVFNSLNGAGTLSARCAIEIHGSDQTVINNEIDGFTIGVNVTGCGVVSHRQLIDRNKLTGVARGFYLWSYEKQEYPDIAMLKNIVITNNHVTINPDAWLASSVLSKNQLAGITSNPLNTSLIENLLIANDTIISSGYANAVQTYTAKSNDCGIVFNKFIFKNVQIVNNLIDKNLGSSIGGDGNIDGLVIQGNKFYNAEMASSSELQNRSAINLTGVIKDFKITNNEIVDTAEPANIAYAIVMINAQSGDNEISGNTIEPSTIPVQLITDGFFITQWNTGIETSIIIPAIGDYTVFWEKEGNPLVNGTITYTNITSENHPELDFGSPGTYILKISPIFSYKVIGFAFTSSESSDAEKLLYVMQWGTNKWSTALSMFYGCKNMDIIATDIPNFTNVNNMNLMFYNCYNLKGENHDFNNWKVNISAMSMTFSGARLFNRPISNWNVSRVSTFYRTFHGTNQFNQPLNNWSISGATAINEMFNNAKSFNQPLNSWNTENITNMKSLFYNAESFNQSLANWSLKSIPANSTTAMELMLSGSGVNSTNYDAILNAWVNDIDTPDSLTFGANGLLYSSAAVTAHNTLIISKGWRIVGDAYDGLYQMKADVDQKKFEEQMNVVIKNKQVIIKNVNDNDVIHLIDISGHLCASQQVYNNQAVFYLDKVGVYILNNITQRKYLKIVTWQ